MIDPMVKALAESVAKDNGWPFSSGTSCDGKKLEFMAFKIKGMNIFIEELTPATEEDLVHYNKMVEEYRKHEAEQQAAEAAQHVQNEREAQLKEMLDKAETEEERQQILAMMNN